MKNPPAGVAARRAPDPVNPLILDLLDWLAAGPRAYADVMDAWRTSCPRLTIWEDALDLGYVAREHGGSGTGLNVALTSRGQGLLRAHRPRA